MRTEGWEGPKGRKEAGGCGRDGGELFANGIKCSRDSWKDRDQFKSRGICRNGTMVLSVSNITCNSYNAFLVLLRFSFILFPAHRSRF